MSDRFEITRIDARSGDPLALLAPLREKLSPRGDIVSEAGRQRTIEVFGEPLSPQQVVTRILQRVRVEGRAAVLELTEKLDRARVDADSLRVSPEKLAEAHAQASPEFLASVRRIRENVRQFQEAILHQDVSIERAAGIRLTQRYLPLQRIGVCVPGARRLIRRRY
ncbi:MAG: histidinol dehydrogenase [Pirellulaceae bacterium]